MISGMGRFCYFAYRMNKTRLILTKKCILGMLIMLMGLMAVNRALYTHVHVLADGTVETHAHPFSKSSEGTGGDSHQHAKVEWILLHNLDLLIITSLAAFVFVPTGGSEPATIRTRTRFSGEPLLLRNGRAPPAGC